MVELEAVMAVLRWQCSEKPWKTVHQHQQKQYFHKRTLKCVEKYHFCHRNHFLRNAFTAIKCNKNTICNASSTLSNRRRRFILYGSLMVVLGSPFISMYASMKYILPQDSIHKTAFDMYVGGTAIVRAIRDAVLAIQLVYYYKRILKKGDEAKYEEWSWTHKKCAQLIKRTCEANEGIYIKAGQQLHQMSHVLPDEITSEMASMLDHAPLSSGENVREVIREDLGRWPEEIFEEFQWNPVASASLAQVHRARYHGKVVAVKVQHRGLQTTARADIATVNVLVNIVYRMFNFDYRFLADVVSKHLPNELDFMHEGANCEQARQNFANNPNVVIPRIYWEATSTRVLTMDWIDAVNTEPKALQSIGLKFGDVAALIAKTFAKQIFIDGFLHADPHAANCKMRRGPNGEPQMVLLDHGLYARLNEHLKLIYARLWSAIISNDRKAIVELCDELNIRNPELQTVFVGMLSYRPWEDLTAAKTVYGDVVKFKEQTRKYVAKHNVAIQQILSLLPADLLLVLKANDCLRAIDVSLAMPLNTTKTIAYNCIAGINTHRLRKHPGLRTHFLNFKASLNMWLRFEMLEFMLRIVNFFARIRLFLFHDEC